MISSIDNSNTTMNLSSCASWICKGNLHKSPPTPTEYTTTVTSGPGPSPGSSGSCDDVVPPPKNCYRLVMLGKKGTQSI